MSTSQELAIFSCCDWKSDTCDTNQVRNTTRQWRNSGELVIPLDISSSQYRLIKTNSFVIFKYFSVFFFFIPHSRSLSQGQSRKAPKSIRKNSSDSDYYYFILIKFTRLFCIPFVATLIVPAMPSYYTVEINKTEWWECRNYTKSTICWRDLLFLLFISCTGKYLKDTRCSSRLAGEWIIAAHLQLRVRQLINFPSLCNFSGAYGMVWWVKSSSRLWWRKVMRNILWHF